MRPNFPITYQTALRQQDEARCIPEIDRSQTISSPSWYRHRSCFPDRQAPHHRTLVHGTQLSPNTHWIQFTHAR